MTCASCAARIEKKLNKLDGVSATVNYATETAHVSVTDPSVDTDALLTTVEKLGYSATLPEAAQRSQTATRRPTPRPTMWRQRLIIASFLALPVLLMSMIPPLQFTNWQWLALTLASPVVVWGAWPFHHAAWVNLRHGTATMDTLISVGVGAAYLWSVYALFFGEAGMPGMTMEMSFTASGNEEIYLEVASVVTVFIVAGRYLERRAKQRSGQALRALLSLGAKDVGTPRRRRGPAYRSISSPSDDIFVVRPGERIATDGVVVEGSSAVDTVDADRRERSGRGRRQATPWSARPSTSVDASWSVRRGSAPTPSWRRWQRWSQRRRRERLRSSGSQTGWPPSSSRSSS